MWTPELAIVAEGDRSKSEIKQPSRAVSSFPRTPTTPLQRVLDIESCSSGTNKEVNTPLDVTTITQQTYAADDTPFSSARRTIAPIASSARQRSLADASRLEPCGTETAVVVDMSQAPLSFSTPRHCSIGNDSYDTALGSSSVPCGTSAILSSGKPHHLPTAYISARLRDRSLQGHSTKKLTRHNEQNAVQRELETSMHDAAEGVHQQEHSAFAPESLLFSSDAVTPQSSHAQLTHLRKQLSLSQCRNRVLSDELETSRALLNNSSVCVDMREQECVELNACVDALQKNNDMLRQELLRAQAEIEESRVRESCALRELEEQRLVSENLTSQVQQQRQQIVGLTTSASSPSFEDLQVQHEGLRIVCQRATQENALLASELATVKVMLAEARAVLDRLELHPPFPEALIGSAKRIKSTFVAV